MPRPKEIAMSASRYILSFRSILIILAFSLLLSCSKDKSGPGPVKPPPPVTPVHSDVAFQRPDGKIVLIVLNESSESQTFNIRYKDEIVSTMLSGGSVATFVW